MRAPILLFIRTLISLISWKISTSQRPYFLILSYEGLGFNTRILGGQKHNYAYTQSHAPLYRNVQLRSHALTHSYSATHVGIHTITCAGAHTHTAKSYFHPDSHTESYSHAPSPAPSRRSHLLSSALCLSQRHSFTHLASLSPARRHPSPKSRPPLVVCSTRRASPNNCFLSHSCHFFFKKFFCKMVDYSAVLVSGVSKVNQAYVCTYARFFRFFPNRGCYRVLSRVPCAYCTSPLVTLFTVVCIRQS